MVESAVPGTVKQGMGQADRVDRLQAAPRRSLDPAHRPDPDAPVDGIARPNGQAPRIHAMPAPVVQVCDKPTATSWRQHHAGQAARCTAGFGRVTQAASVVVIRYEPSRQRPDQRRRRPRGRDQRPTANAHAQGHRTADGRAHAAAQWRQPGANGKKALRYAGDRAGVPSVLQAYGGLRCKRHTAIGSAGDMTHDRPLAPKLHPRIPRVARWWVTTLPTPSSPAAGHWW